MAIYKMVGDKERLDEVKPTSFGNEGVMERNDLQRILRKQPSILEKGLLIIDEEFGNWQDSNRRIDLLGLDESGRLVVIELKRGETGEHMDLQSIRYAAMVANMTFQQAVDTYQSYLQKQDEEGDAEELVRDHLEKAEATEIYTAKPRIILVSEGFSAELTTSALWLNDNGLEVTCIRIQPYRNREELLVETSQIIPLPEAAGYIISVRDRVEEQTRRQRPERGQHIPGGGAFMESIARARREHQPGLQQLYDCAIDLERASLAELSTHFVKQDLVRLNLRVPGEGQHLVSFNNLIHKGGRGGEIIFWADWENIAPDSLLHINQLIGPAKSDPGIRYRRLSRISSLDPILAGIRDAYREANGRMDDEDGNYQ